MTAIFTCGGLTGVDAVTTKQVVVMDMSAALPRAEAAFACDAVGTLAIVALPDADVGAAPQKPQLDV